MGYQPIKPPSRPKPDTPSAPKNTVAGSPPAAADLRRSKPVFNEDELTALSGDKAFLTQGFAEGSPARQIMEAAFDGDAARLKMLLQNENTLPDFKNDFGFTPLMVAAARGNAQVVEVLASHPLVDLGRQHRDGWTALHYAAWFDHPQTVSVLLSHFAPLDAETSEGKKPHDVASDRSTEAVFWQDRHFIRFMKGLEPSNPRLLPQQETQEVEGQKEAPGQQAAQKAQDEPVKGAFIRALISVGLEMKNNPGINVRAKVNEQMAKMNEAQFRDAFETIKSTELKYDWKDVFIRAAGEGNTAVMVVLQEHGHFEGRTMARALSAAVEKADHRDAVHHLLMWGADPEDAYEVQGVRQKTNIHRQTFKQKRAGAFEEMVLWGEMMGGITALDDYELAARLHLTALKASRIVRKEKGSRQEDIGTSLREMAVSRLHLATQIWRQKLALKGSRSKKLKNIFNQAVRQDSIGVVMAAYAEARQSRLFRGKVKMEKESAGSAMAIALLHKRYEFARMLAADGYRLQDATPDLRFKVEHKGTTEAKRLARIFLTAKEKPVPLEDIGKMKLSPGDMAIYTGGMYGMGRIGM